jgi:hypothetical protein
MRRADLLFDAAKRADRVQTYPMQEAVGDCASGLHNMLQAGSQVCQARTGAGNWRMEASKSLLDGWGHWPLFDDQRDFIYNVLTQLEPDVNTLLRERIQSAIWRAPAAGSPGAADEVAVPAAEVMAGMNCLSLERADGVVGRLFVQGRDGAVDDHSRRALFVPDAPTAGGTGELRVFSASFDPASRRCTLGTQVLHTPAVLNSSVVFDASLRLFYYTVAGRGLPGSLIVQELDWERGPGDEHYANRQTRASITDAKAIAAVQLLAGAERAAVAPTFRVPGGRVVDMRSPAEVKAGAAGLRWFVANTLAQRLDGLDPAARLEPLVAAGKGSPCERLAQGFAPAPGFTTEVFEQGGRCFRISRGWPAPEAGKTVARPTRDDLRVVVLDKPPSAELLKRAQENPPAPLASMLPFARMPRVAAAAPAASRTTWWVGTSGTLDGWLVMQVETPSAEGKTAVRRFGAPWSTCALSRMGGDLLSHNPTAASLPGAPRNPQAPSANACLRL